MAPINPRYTRGPGPYCSECGQHLLMGFRHYECGPCDACGLGWDRHRGTECDPEAVEAFRRLHG